MLQYLLIQILIILKKMNKINQKMSNSFMERESDYDNDGLDPSEEYLRKKKKGND